MMITKLSILTLSTMKIKAFITYLAAIFLISAVHAQDRTRANKPDLFLEEDEILYLEPGIYEFGTIHLGKNADLRFGDLNSKGGREWVQIYADELLMDDFSQIIYIQMKRGLGNIAATTLYDRELSYKFPEEAIGGSGGDGSNRDNQETKGGNGYQPKANQPFGGGGGSGAWYGSDGNYNGVNASGINGAISAPSNHLGRGGKGASPINIDFPHGGLIYIRAINIKSSPSAQIVAHGMPGGKGVNGTGSFSKATENSCRIAPGGGGGGSAGGDGGVVILEYRNMESTPDITVLPGRGGEGGKGLRGTRTVFQSKFNDKCTPFKGDDGLSGDEGALGKVEITQINWRED